MPKQSPFGTMFDDGQGNTGTYRLTHNHLTFDLKQCDPRVSGTNITLRAVGGIPGSTFVTVTSTEVTTPLAEWTPFRTNQFDRLGTDIFTNRFDHTEPKRFFGTRQE